MLEIINNLTSLAMLPIGLILDRVVILLMNPLGFFFVFSSVTFIEYKTGESIIRNKNIINFKAVLDYIKKYRTKDVSLISSQWEVLEMISKKKNICVREISDSIGMTTLATKTMMSGLVDNGYITREVGSKNSRTVCYAISNDYKSQVIL